jgi:heme exporter protein A
LRFNAWLIRAFSDFCYKDDAFDHDLAADGFRGVGRVIPSAVLPMMRLAGRDLDCVRGDRKVLSGLNFVAQSGEPLAVTGRNGAGKTTLLRLVAGLIEPAHGNIELSGGPPDLTVAEQAHYLGHRDALKPALSVSENLQFWHAFLGGNGASIPSSLDAVGLGGLAHLPAGYLSAGQRRRLSIARLLAAPRPIWLLDEPTAALDTAGQDRLAELMRAHLAGGGILIAATHGPLGLAAKELRLESPPRQPAPPPLVASSQEATRR